MFGLAAGGVALAAVPSLASAGARSAKAAVAKVVQATIDIETMAPGGWRTPHKWQPTIAVRYADGRVALFELDTYQWPAGLRGDAFLMPEGFARRGGSRA